MKLSKGKNLLVFFGCLPIKRDESKKEEDIFSMKMEDILKRRKQRAEKILSVRTRIVEGLNRSRDVTNVSDLFSKLPQDFHFNPILFKMHIPLSLQLPTYVKDSSIRAEIEDFWLVYDGFMFMVAAMCDLGKRPYGVFDVRDRFKKVFEPIIEMERIVSPSLYSKPVTFLMQGDDLPSRARMPIKIGKPTESRILLRDLYKKIAHDIRGFYGLCSLSNEIDKEISDIERRESVLLGNLLKFFNADWWKIPEKWNLINRCKREMADILQKVSEYLSDQNQLKRGCGNFKKYALPREGIFTELFDARTFDYYTEPVLFLDTDSVLRVVDHVRSETEAYSLNTSTIFSALLGAVVGSVITLVVSYAL